jgi:hypothetical protein
MACPRLFFTNNKYVLKKIMAFIVPFVTKPDCSTVLGGDLYTVSVSIGLGAKATPFSE